MMKSDSMSHKENGTSRPLKQGRSSQFPMQFLLLMIGPFHSVGCDRFSQHYLCDISPHDLLGPTI
jgi:hypothetical protein